jgi:beta-lactamase class A
VGRLAALAVLAGLLAAAPAAAPASWAERKADAIDYAQNRAGVESFALVDDRGRLHGYRVRARVPSASLLKAMALVAYLDMRPVRHRELTAHERALLGPMIRRSDNAAAGTILRAVGSTRLHRLARRAGMHEFSFAWPVWGLSTTSARDQARFFHRIDRLVVRRHRRYARWQLAHVVPSQRWGIPPAAPSGWRIFLKGGWGSGTGWVTHQSALLRRGSESISLSVLTRRNPSHAYGTATIEGVAARLLARPFPPAAP